MAHKTWTVTAPYLNIHCALGEAPFHEPTTQTLRFVDIKNHRLHTLDISQRSTQSVAKDSDLSTLKLKTPVSVTADIEGVDPSLKIAVGAKRGLATLDRKTGEVEYIRRFLGTEKGSSLKEASSGAGKGGEKEGDDGGYDVEQEERLRSNDGAVDPTGTRFWIGTMNDFHIMPPQDEGSLFRFAKEGKDVTRSLVQTKLTIPNGIGWTPETYELVKKGGSGKGRMFFTHSAMHVIHTYEYDVGTGELSNEAVFYKHDGKGEPDGFAVDKEGCLWQCVYNEGRVLRLKPVDDGKGGVKAELVGEVKLPTNCCTCPVFVGTELWVTSAAEEEPEKFPESAKHGGALFRVDVGVEGMDPVAFKLG